MKIRQRIGQILDKALDWQELSREEALELMRIDEKSDEMYALMSAANSMTREKVNNIGEVFAQIGINNWPCPKNCKFCFFGEAWGLIKEPMELSVDQVVFRAKEFEKAGANNIFLMTTANYPFKKFLEIGREVRKAISPEMPLSANIGDFGPAEARQLEDAGFQSAYHIYRMREGIDTGIDPEIRKKTLETIRDSRLALVSCIEPVGPEHTDEEIVDEMFRTLGYKPNMFSVMIRFPVPGTPLAEKGKVSELKFAKIAAVGRLVCGDRVKNYSVHGPSTIVLASGSSAIAAESGSNPRDTSEDTSKGIGLSVEVARQMLREADFVPLEGFSKVFNKT
ncbi:MAG: radical SAM protein [Nitrospirae bacterium]|nr:radical SAM protein [Nitrospirota bacterium]